MRYNTEKIGKTIESERKKSGYSQEGLGKELGVVGKQISNYERGKTLPPTDVLFKMCDIFNCELGYLLGERDYIKGTKIKTLVSQETGLNIEALNVIKTITGTERSCINWGYESEKYRRVLNKLLISAEFIDFVKALGDMEEVYEDKENTQQPLEALRENLGNELFDLACKYSGSCAEELDGLHLSEEEINAINLFDKAQDECYSLYLKNEYDIKVCKYSVQEALTILINRLYDPLCNKAIISKSKN